MLFASGFRQAQGLAQDENSKCHRNLLSGVQRQLFVINSEFCLSW